MKKLIKFKPSAKTYFDIAEDKYDCGDLSGSVQYFFKAQEERGDIDSLIALGEVYAELGQPEEGLKYLFRALDLCPDDHEICHSIAQCFLDMDDEETAFFYFQPGMTINRFNRMMEDDGREEGDYPPIRVVEKDDEITLGIAIKLLSSGDAVYAREVLRTIKQGSPQYTAACNLLSLSALEFDEPDEALEYANKALEAGGDIDSRCNLMLAYFAQENMQKAMEISDFLERQKLTLSARKTVSLAYIRMDEAEKAARHLKVLHDNDPFCRDTAVSYALACYRTGDKTRAKQVIVEMGKAYPGDIVVREIAAAFARGEQLSLLPVLGEERAAEWLTEIDDRLTAASKGFSELGGLGKIESDDDFTDDREFVDKIRWLFQSHYTSRQGKAALILGRFPRWHGFLREQLLDNSMGISTKKACLCALLLGEAKGGLGLVIYGMYSRLKVRYPVDMDENFRMAYCLTFSSFALSDSCFENKLFAAAKRLLKKYNEVKEDAWAQAFAAKLSLAKADITEENSFAGGSIAADNIAETSIEDSSIKDSFAAQEDSFSGTEGEIQDDSTHKSKEKVKRTAKNREKNARKTDSLFESEILAAALFHHAHHKQISGTLACSQLFGCDHQKLKDCLSLLGIK